MFTSRAEFRLLLREDNADLRLTEQGRALGLIPDERWVAFEIKREGIEQERQRLRDIWLHPNTTASQQAMEQMSSSISRETRALDLLSRPEVDYAGLMKLDGIGPGVEDAKVAEQLEIQSKYAGYIERQQGEIERQRANESVKLPQDFDYEKVRGLSNEVREKLIKRRPETIGQAGRIPGITPASISLLLIHLKRKSA
jgi:tRNA uridine 5-carboxymethylaminomethyl modification enzyme